MRFNQKSAPALEFLKVKCIGLANAVICTDFDEETIVIIQNLFNFNIDCIECKISEERETVYKPYC